VTTPDVLLDRTPDDATRRIALDFLEQAEAARHRLDDADDAEALHDFRVALRRLRSAIRAFAHELHDAVGRKARKRLRTLADETGASRDAEVQLGWLEKLGATLEPSERDGALWLAGEVSAQKAEADARLARDVTAGFDRLHRRLDARLREYTQVVRVGEEVARGTFAGVVAHHARALADALHARLDAIASVDDQDAAHEARIAAKRLRYLLEPVAAEIDGAPALVKRIKGLQDVLGDMHDMDVLGATVARALDDGEAASVRPGLVALAARVREERDRLYAKADATWLGGRGREALAEIAAVADALDRRAPSGVEIERKYLLRALPERVAGAPAKEIVQGWLPGERLRERLRGVRGDDGTERCYRTVKLGLGLVRTEIEEETSHELFSALWKHTAERRVRKRRYAIVEGDRTWEIDEFTDRELFLAEVELPHADAAAEPPEWLAPYIVREVTGESEYVNYNLGRPD
jgi:CHAD domain-containing protein/CYTH domain-containing protein